MWLILMLLSWFTGAVMSTNPSPKYTVLEWELEFTDCTVPSEMARYQFLKRCLEPENILLGIEKRFPAILVTSRRIRTSIGVRCSAVSSEFRGYCGAYSHWKFQSVPRVKQMVLVDMETCLKAWKSSRVRMPDGSTRNIRVGEVVKLDYIPSGELIVDRYKTSCVGSQVKFGSKLVDESLILASYEFSLQPEKFLISTSGTIEAFEDRSQLPITCVPANGACEVEGKSFAWSLEQLSCPFLKVRSLNLVEDGAGIWLDTKVGALFNVSNPHTLNSPGCPSITVYMTQMRDMLVSRDVVAQTLHEVDADNL